MSLISDALKKAERDRRKADAEPPVATPPPPPSTFPSEASEPNRTPKSNTLLLGLVAGTVVVVAGAAYFIFARGNSTPSETNTKVAQAPTGNAMTKEPKAPEAQPEITPIAIRHVVAETPPIPPAKPDTTPPLSKPVVKADPSILTPSLAPAFNAPPQVSSSHEESPPPAQPSPVITPAPVLQPPAPKPSPVASTPAPAPEPVAPAEPLRAAITASPIIASVTPPLMPVVETPPPAPAPVLIAALPPEPKPVAVPPTAPPPVVAAKPGPNPAAQTFVDQIVLGGVRLGGVQLILIKGAVYKPGDPVNADLKLKLLSVQPHDITFADESGFQYHKRY